VTSYIGTARSQNAKGNMLGHVTNKGASITTSHGRGYQSNEALGFHADGCDVTSLFCLQTAKARGIHKVCSSVALYNEMFRRRPDLVKELTYYFYLTRKGLIPDGETEPWYRLPVFSVQDGYFTARGASNTLTRSRQLPGAPPLTPKQLEAIELYQRLAGELAIDVLFERGDMAYSNSHITLHSRTEFEDWPELDRRRHLVRLWMRIEEGRRPIIPELAREIERGISLRGSAYRSDRRRHPRHCARPRPNSLMEGRQTFSSILVLVPVRCQGRFTKWDGRNGASARSSSFSALSCSDASQMNRPPNAVRSQTP
jgi:hypothetical protein